MSERVVYSTKDFDVVIGESTHPDIPVERRRVYFVRHRDHAVTHVQTNLLGEAIMMAVTMQKGTDAVLANPESPDLDAVLPGMGGGGLRGGLN